MKVKVLKFTFLLLFIYGCNKSDSSRLATIIAINEIQDCEEHNIFYRIVNSDREELKNNKVNRDSIVLLILCDSIKEKNSYNILYPAQCTKRLKVKVKGWFYSTKMSLNNSYGCPNARKFHVLEIINIEDVTETEDFKISN